MKRVNAVDIKRPWKITIYFHCGLKLVFPQCSLRTVDIDKWVSDWVSCHCHFVRGKPIYSYLAEPYVQQTFAF